MCENERVSVVKIKKYSGSISIPFCFNGMVLLVSTYFCIKT